MWVSRWLLGLVRQHSPVGFERPQESSLVLQRSQRTIQIDLHLLVLKHRGKVVAGLGPLGGLLHLLAVAGTSYAAVDARHEHFAARPVTRSDDSPHRKLLPIKQGMLRLNRVVQTPSSTQHAAKV